MFLCKIFKSKLSSKKKCLNSPAIHIEELEYSYEIFNTKRISVENENLSKVGRFITERVLAKYKVVFVPYISAIHKAMKLMDIKQNKMFCASIRPFL